MLTRSVPDDHAVALVRERWPAGELLAARLRTGPWVALAVERWDEELANGWAEVLLSGSSRTDAYFLDVDGYWSWPSVAVVPALVHDMISFFDDGELLHLASRTVTVPDAAFIDDASIEDPMNDVMLSLCVGIEPRAGSLHTRDTTAHAAAQQRTSAVRTAARRARAAVGASATYRVLQRCGEDDVSLVETAEILMALEATATA